MKKMVISLRVFVFVCLCVRARVYVLDSVCFCGFASVTVFVC